MAIKIVVIDDETQIRRMLRIALTSEGYDVTEAENGQQGLAAVARQQPELVILDLGLPDMEGHQVLQELRGWSDVAVIVLSVRNQDKEKVAALDAGAQDYVTKPFSVEELLARVRAILRDHIKPEKLPILDDGKLQIDLSRRLVKVDHQIVELTTQYCLNWRRHLTALSLRLSCSKKFGGPLIQKTHIIYELWSVT